MYLEDEGATGSQGAHWDRAILKNEIMTAADIVGDIEFSGATIGLL